MDRIATPLGPHGDRICRVEGATTTPPLDGHEPAELRAIDYHVPVASAQVKSAILLAGLFADGDTHVREDVRTRRTTEDMLRAAGIDSSRAATWATGARCALVPGRPHRRDWHVPGDPSQAAFFAVLGRDSSRRHPRGPERRGDSANASVSWACSSAWAPTSASMTATASPSCARAARHCVATEIHSNDVPSVDEVPVLTVAACAASGVSAFRSMGELRHKESDRFAGSLASPCGSERARGKRATTSLSRDSAPPNGSCDFTFHGRSITAWSWRARWRDAPGTGRRSRGGHGLVELSAFLSRPSIAAMSSQVIAIDGPAGSGKSTLARALAERPRLVLSRHGRHVPRGHR